MSLQTQIAAGFARLVQAVNALQTALGAKAPLNSPALTGAPTAPTAASSVATGQIASTAYVKSLFGAATGSGVLDWNDVSNTAAGGGPTLLTGSAANGPVASGAYFHPLNFEYNSKNGTGQITQMAIAYGNMGNEIYMRGRYLGAWTSWVRFLNSGNIGSFAPGLTGFGASGTWPISITGGAATASTATALQTPCGIGDVSFNGSESILPQRIGYKDTRAFDFPPTAYPGVTLHLRNNTTDGLTDGGTYHGILNLQQWGDFTGGPAHQLGFTENGNISHRCAASATTWGPWSKLLAGDNFTNFAPTKTGEGASGTWGINITGNATGLLLGGSSGTAGQVPVSQGPALPPVWATPTAAGVNVQVFTTPGSSTWVKPAGAKLVEVIMIGGGGGGGSGRKGLAGTLVCGGGGGASGARAEFSISPTALGSTANVTVGAGGSGGASVSANSSNGLNGSFGGSSFFNFQLTASGVNPGQGGTSFSGTGGTNTNGLGFPNAPGFSGASGGSVTTSTAAGGSGGVNGVSATGGGAGGGILATGVLGASGAGGQILLSGNSGFVDIAPGAAGATGANGGDGKSDGAALWSGGTGGGGGGASTTGNAGAGGAGGNYGAGGGGGGAALDGVGNSGAGGRGGDGIVVVITYL